MLLVLDAAYAEYVDDGDDYEVGDALVDAADNVVMLRTFSKIYGLAGARIGWGYCSRSVADVLHRVRPLDSVTASAAAAAVAALDDVEHIELCRAENARWRTWFVDQASKMGGVTPYPSHGNFVLMRFSDEPGRGAAAVYEALRRRGVIARPMTPYGLADCLRFTIGTGEEMQLAAETLHAVLAAAT